MKLRSAITYGFGRHYRCGTTPWSQNLATQRWEGNPSVSVSVSRYMLSLRKQKVWLLDCAVSYPICSQINSALQAINMRWAQGRLPVMSSVGFISSTMVKDVQTLWIFNLPILLMKLSGGIHDVDCWCTPSLHWPLYACCELTRFWIFNSKTCNSTAWTTSRLPSKHPRPTNSVVSQLTLWLTKCAAHKAYRE